MHLVARYNNFSAFYIVENRLFGHQANTGSDFGTLRELQKSIDIDTPAAQYVCKAIFVFSYKNVWWPAPHVALALNGDCIVEIFNTNAVVKNLVHRSRVCGVHMLRDQRRLLVATIEDLQMHDMTSGRVCSIYKPQKIDCCAICFTSVASDTEEFVAVAFVCRKTLQYGVDFVSLLDMRVRRGPSSFLALTDIACSSKMLALSLVNFYNPMFLHIKCYSFDKNHVEIRHLEQLDIDTHRPGQLQWHGSCLVGTILRPVDGPSVCVWSVLDFDLLQNLALVFHSRLVDVYLLAHIYDALYSDTADLFEAEKITLLRKYKVATLKAIVKKQKRS